MTGKGKGRFDYDDVQDGAPFEPSPLPKRCRRYVDSDTENTVAAGVLYFVGDEPVDDTEECSCTSLSSSDIASPAPLATVFGGIGARALALSLPDYATIRGSPPDSRKTRTCEIISIPVLALSTPPTFPPLTPPLYIARSGCYSGFANDSPHPIVFSGKKYRTATHLIEALRYMDHAPDFAEKIRKCNSVRKVHKVSDSGRPRKPHWATLLPEMVKKPLWGVYGLEAERMTRCTMPFSKSLHNTRTCGGCCLIQAKLR
ncbi:hypothetical protein AX17_006499 [Amanita inopinata Kibby_2008]|nr:hypothetical protein AX17_006499 [Amanita inopinata Kibby_2008]